MNIKLIKKMYYKDKMTYKQIANHFGYKSVKPIFTFFKKNNLKARDDSTKRIGYHHSEKTKENIGNSNIGKHNISEETRENLRKSHLGQIPWNKNKVTGIKPWLGKKRSKLDRIKMSKSAIKYLEKSKTHRLLPRTGIYETKILDNLEYCFGYLILRQHEVGRYSLDGYCPMLSLAIEVDERIHQNNIEEDKLRENQIKELINCNFLRIDIGKVI